VSLSVIIRSQNHILKSRPFVIGNLVRIDIGHQQVIEIVILRMRRASNC
jgi:hypothetical protein